MINKILYVLAFLKSNFTLFFFAFAYKLDSISATFPAGGLNMWLDFAVIVCFIPASESSFSVYYGFPLCSKVNFLQNLNSFKNGTYGNILINHFSQFLTNKNHLYVIFIDCYQY